LEKETLKTKAIRNYVERLRQLDSTPYLTLPIKRQRFKITEGWFYSEEEKKIHGREIHGGIDFKAKLGKPVYASVSGWATSSYHNRPVKNKDGSERLYKGKPITNGLGYFVQIYHPENGRYTQYGHLGKIVQKIPFGKPRKRKDTYYPYGYKIKPENMENSKYYVWVNQGELIGYVGDSGLCWGYKDYPQRPNPSKYPSWDEVHLHFEEFSRNKKGIKKQLRDPFNIYSTFKDYPKNTNQISKNTLWELQ
jgi:murein DD-endopeptidase MepM/ murein hydrolase activator NlpD